MAEEAFLGVGWQFPVAVVTGKDEKTGKDKIRIATSEYIYSIEESIRIILGTSRGERIMRPDFGSDLNKLVFAPNNSSTAGLAMFYVQEALKAWEPRIESVNVDAHPDGEDANRLLITIDYKIIATNTEHNLVYPFYLGNK